MIRRDAELLALGEEWMSSRKRDDRGPVGWADYPAGDKWQERWKTVLGVVTDWIWLRLMDYPLPRDKWGAELIEW